MPGSAICRSPSILLFFLERGSGASRAVNFFEKLFDKHQTAHLTAGAVEVVLDVNRSRQLSNEFVSGSLNFRRQTLDLVRVAVGILERLAPHHLLHQKIARHARVGFSADIHTCVLQQKRCSRHWIDECVARFIDATGPLLGHTPFGGRARGKLIRMHQSDCPAPGFLHLVFGKRKDSRQRQKRKRVLSHCDALDVERLAASAAFFFLRIVVLEAFLQTFLDVVKFGTVNVGQALGIYHDLYAVTFPNLIVFVDDIGKLKLVGHTRATARLDTKAQTDALAALGQKSGNVAGSRLGKSD
jgi:hypothetical protein